MNQSIKLRRTQERHYSAHHMLIETARRSNEHAKAQEPGWLYDVVSAITFSALAVEALANSFGERKVKNWSDFESASPNAKLQVVAQSLSISYDSKTEPWSTARWLMKTRNLIAHAKPQLLKEEFFLTQEEIDHRMFDKPEAKLEKEMTLANADRATRTAIAFKDILCDSISPSEALGLIADGWSGSISLPDAPDYL
jgi:hypothetical protein